MNDTFQTEAYDMRYSGCTCRADPVNKYMLKVATGTLEKGKNYVQS